MPRRPIPGLLLGLGIFVIIVGTNSLLARGFGGLVAGSIYAIAANIEGILIMATLPGPEVTSC